MISGAFGALNGIKGSSPHSQAFLDISSSRDLYFLTMVGWENRHKEAHSATTAERKLLSLDHVKEEWVRPSAILA